MKRFPVILILALALAACGNVPQPFRGTAKVTTDNPLLDMPSAVGIAVLPVRGLPEPFNGQLTAAVAAGLQAYEIPAEAVPNNTGVGFSLEAAALTQRDGGMNALQIDWTLRTRSGAERSRFSQSAALPDAALAGGSEAAAAQLAAEVAEAMVAAIEGQVRTTAPLAMPTPQPQPVSDFPTVSVRPVEGAPGDGRDALRLAVLQGLLDNGIRRDDVNPEVILTCVFTATPANDFRQNVAIVWTAVLADGTELGQMTLENTIPAGALDRQWGPSAFSIAAAALPDIMQLLILARDG